LFGNQIGVPKSQKQNQHFDYTSPPRITSSVCPDVVVYPEIEVYPNIRVYPDIGIPLDFIGVYPHHGAVVY
jgi:hypothetical protein